MPEPQTKDFDVVSVEKSKEANNIKELGKQKSIEKNDLTLKESLPIDETNVEEYQNIVKSAEKIQMDYDSYNFDAFISKMRHESCKPVLENIKRFIKVFLDKLPTSNIEDMVEAYKSFYSVIKVKCMQAEIWRSEETSPMERANALEGLESLIMNQLHDRVICYDSSERDLDNFMEKKMALHGGWIKLEHLDVSQDISRKLQENEEIWMSTAVTEFQKMSIYRTPRDKLVCALNGCKIINSLISGTEMGADDFLPILIYTLIRSNSPHLYSNINYISRFRAPERISGEVAYSFTHLMAASEFIEKMDRNALKIEEEDYEKFMEASIEEFNQRPNMGIDSQDSLELTFNEKLDFAEAKAEELFIKAKEAFKVTGERANQAFSTFKESNLAKKSMEKLNNFFVKDFKEKDQERIAENREDFESQLARAVSLSLLDEAIIVEETDSPNEESSTATTSENVNESNQNE